MFVEILLEFLCIFVKFLEIFNVKKFFFFFENSLTFTRISPKYRLKLFEFVLRFYKNFLTDFLNL